MGSSIRRRLARSWPAARGQRGVFAIAVLATLLSACAGTTPPQPVPQRLPAGIEPYLIAPGELCEPGGAVAAEADDAFRRLLADAEPERAAATARAILARTPESLAAHALLAQAELVSGRWPEAIAATTLSPEALALCPAAALARARALEAAGEIPEAYVSYQLAAGVSEVAVRRSAALGDAARSALRERFAAARARGHVDEAARQLELLETWWPRSEAALRSRMELAAATGDIDHELSVVRALHEGNPTDPELTLRRGRLEIEAGDARLGLGLIERLAAASSGDEVVQQELARARFQWRLLNAPESVRRLRRKPEMTRADLAVLIYWMVPRVRTARPEGGTIASDILDHDSREEIVRLVNLGLMRVDETLHRFSPGAPLRRQEALSTLLRLVRFGGVGGGGGGGCAGERGGTRDEICARAADCGLIDSPSECDGYSTVSGAEAIELLRAALDASGES